MPRRLDLDSAVRTVGLDTRPGIGSQKGEVRLQRFAPEDGTGKKAERFDFWWCDADHGRTLDDAVCNYNDAQEKAAPIAWLGKRAGVEELSFASCRRCSRFISPRLGRPGPDSTGS